jgi:hypothetical protein
LGFLLVFFWAQGFAMLPQPGTMPHCDRVSLLRVRFNSLGVGLLDTYTGGFAVFETYGYAGFHRFTRLKKKKNVFLEGNNDVASCASVPLTLAS